MPSPSGPAPFGFYRIGAVGLTPVGYFVSIRLDGFGSGLARRGSLRSTSRRWFRADGSRFPAGNGRGRHPGGGASAGRPGHVRAASASPQADAAWQVPRLQAFAREQGRAEVEGAVEIGSGRKGLLRVSQDPGRFEWGWSIATGSPGSGLSGSRRRASASRGRPGVGSLGDPDLGPRVAMQAAVSPQPSEADPGGDGVWARQAFRFELDPSREARMASANPGSAVPFACHGGPVRCPRSSRARPRRPSGTPSEGLSLARGTGKVTPLAA
jgi:hypothetical protein